VNAPKIGWILVSDSFPISYKVVAVMEPSGSRLEREYPICVHLHQVWGNGEIRMHPTFKGNQPVIEPFPVYRHLRPIPGVDGAFDQMEDEPIDSPTWQCVPPNAVARCGQTLSLFGDHE
jgi:hypothetical protein